MHLPIQVASSVDQTLQTVSSCVEGSETSNGYGMAAPWKGVAGIIWQDAFADAMFVRATIAELDQTLLLA